MPQVLDASAARPSIETIVRGLGESRRLFLEEPESFRIVCAIEKVTAFSPDGEWTRAEVIAARKGDKWFTQERLRDPTPADGDDKRVYASKNEKALDWRTFNRSCMISRASENPNVCLNWVYTQIMGFGVYRDIARSHGADYDAFCRLVEGNEWTFDRPYLPEYIAQHATQYKVSLTQETVDGFPCWVVEWPGMDRLSIDISHGFAIRQRSYHWDPGKPLRYNIWQKDFREVKEGLWLPYIQIVEECGRYPDGDERWWGEPINRVEYHLKEVTFNNLEDDFFDVHLPPGTRVLDSIQKKQFTVAAAGADAFDDALDTAERLLAKRRSWSRLLLLLPPLIIVCVMIIARLRRPPARSQS